MTKFFTCPNKPFDFSTLREFEDANFKFDETKFFKRVKSIVRKGELLVTRDSSFSHSDLPCTTDMEKPGLVWERV